MSKCKGCGADIKWIKMKSGKNMPVDEKPVKVVAEVIHDGFPEWQVISAYNPHWATCEKAKEFKKGGKDGDN